MELSIKKETKIRINLTLNIKESQYLIGLLGSRPIDLETTDDAALRKQIAEALRDAIEN